MELCTRNLFLLDKQWINNFIWRCWKRLRDSVRKKKTRNVEQRWLVPSPRQCPAHTALSVQLFLAKNTTVIAHPPYSPDLAPCDFFLSPRMKGLMKRKRFPDVSEVKKKTLEQHQQWRVPEMFSAVGKTLVQVYRVKRRVLWRRLAL